MIRAKQEHTGPIIVDLTGPDGNAFALIGLATRLAKQLGIDSHTINVIKTKMMSGDYEHLLKVFDKYFGDFVILER
jgi:spore maturation protein SpmB|tara:strand:- start:240 stop:467 length:228 start_codon:yes stop_codon:yes gene_type:complete